MSLVVVFGAQVLDFSHEFEWKMDFIYDLKGTKLVSSTRTVIGGQLIQITNAHGSLDCRHQHCT